MIMPHYHALFNFNKKHSGYVKMIGDSENDAFIAKTMHMLQKVEAKRHNVDTFGLIVWSTIWTWSRSVTKPLSNCLSCAGLRKIC